MMSVITFVSKGLMA